MRRYPWVEWSDGSAWEIRRGEDYEVATENMRVNLHLKADALGRKVRTKKITHQDGEGLAFQFIPSEEEELVAVGKNEDPAGPLMRWSGSTRMLLRSTRRPAWRCSIPRRDGGRQKYAAVRFKQQIDKGRGQGTIVPTVARIVRKPTKGFRHLEAAGRHDLMLENLVIDETKPYHRFFSPETIRVSEQRMGLL